jgi:hypothetical protein
MRQAGAVVAATAGLLLGLSGVAQAAPADSGWERAQRHWDEAYGQQWDPADHPDCMEALAKFYVQGAAGGVGGPAGMVGGLAAGLPDVFLDCPRVEPWQQNGT